MTNLLSDGLGELRFAASIDYLSLAGVHKAPLPSLDGEPKWPQSALGRLTIQRCSPADLKQLQTFFPAASLTELEICVDIRPAVSLAQEEHIRLLQCVKQAFVTKGLKPQFPVGTNSEFRGAYVPALGKTLPFNRRLPGVREQLLFGHRNDGAQTKCYLKVTDNRKSLDWRKYSVRIEVRLGPVGLDAHGLLTIADLQSFRIRKELMPYFRHVCGARPRKPRKPSTPLLDVLKAKQGEFDQCHWQKTGVGAFLRGGRRERPDLIFQRDTVINNRIGQALMRLERAVAAEKFVREPAPC